jgi:hypothetical protein
MTDEQLQSSKRYYRNKKKDAALYALLSNKLARFVEFDKLEECAHGMDTQVNESFNNTISWFAPKNKVYCGSTSLRNRIAVAVGNNTLGYVVYFRRLMDDLGITTTDNVLHFLEYKEKVRSKRLAVLKTKDKKKARLKRKFDQLKQDEVDAMISAKKRDGVYESGYHMKEASDDDGEERQQQRGRAKKPSQSRQDVVCPHCLKKGHSTTRSKQCLKNPFYLAGSAAATTQVQHEEAVPDDGLLDPADDILAYDELYQLLRRAAEKDSSSGGDRPTDPEVEVMPVL